MKNKSKQDLAASKTLTSLNSESAMVAQDPEVFRLGQLMRKSASTELPDADTSLRAALVAKIETREKNELGILVPVSPVPVSESRRTWVMAVASIATLALAIISVLWMSEIQSSQRANFEKGKYEPSVYSDSSKGEAESDWRTKLAELPSIVDVKNKENNLQVNASRPPGANSSQGSIALVQSESSPVSQQSIIATNLSEPSMQAGEPAPNSNLFVPTGQATDPIQVSSGLSTNSVESKPESTNGGDGLSTASQARPVDLEPQVKILDVGNASSVKTALHAMFGDKIEVIDSPNQNNASSSEGSAAQAHQLALRQLALQQSSSARQSQAVSGLGGVGGFGGAGGGLSLGFGEAGDDEADGYGIKILGDDVHSRQAVQNNQSSQMMKMMQQMAGGGRSREQYDPIVENKFVEAIHDQALSTFSIDVDTASYSNMRRFISRGQRPPANSIRIEELVNYFQYDYPQPKPGKPFHVAMEVADCPWQPEHRLVRIGIKGKDVHRDERPASNLVFLLDVSGSMKDQDKLPLLQRGLSMMLDRLTENDRISIVTYASNAGVRLQPTSGDQKIKIRDVIDSLSAEGSTNGSAGIEQAYALAAANFIKGGTNRVIMATDGDLNVGTTDDLSLVELIKRKAAEDVFLTVLGFGTGNLKDSKLEKLADNGNGTYAYIDSMREARKVLVQQMSASLVTIAKDVKLQVEFNPAKVKAYRLLGYENRKLANADFRNDKKDAGEIGAGHCVTALYEIVPADLDKTGTLSTKKLKYQESKPAKPASPKPLSPKANSGEMLTLAISHKQPDSDESEQHEYVLVDSKHKFYEASGEFRFAAAVASFGMLLRGSDYSGNMDFSRVEKIASEAIGEDASGYRAEFVDLIRQFSGVSGK